MTDAKTCQAKHNRAPVLTHLPNCDHDNLLRSFAAIFGSENKPLGCARYPLGQVSSSRKMVPRKRRKGLTCSLHFPYRPLALCPVDLRSGRRDGSLRYLFEDYAFDTDRRELHRGPTVVSVAPLAFDLLEYLIRNRERVVSKDEVLKAIWKGRIVSDEALTTRLNAARCAIGDSGEKQHLIKTLPRKGFRFVGAVQEAQRYASAQADASSAKGLLNSNGASLNALSAPPLSIVVLPFANVGGGPEQDYFVDGVTECLTTDLSRIRGSFVIARNSAFSYKGKAIDVRQVGRELNVRYVLEGSVQRGDSRLRVNVQLIDAETGSHLWAERFEKPVADLFDMQDEIVSRLANQLSTELNAVEARRAAKSPDPDSMDLYFQGLACIAKGRAPQHVRQARL